MHLHLLGLEGSVESLAKQANVLAAPRAQTDVFVSEKTCLIIMTALSHFDV